MSCFPFRPRARFAETMEANKGLKIMLGGLLGDLELLIGLVPEKLGGWGWDGEISYPICSWF